MDRSEQLVTTLLLIQRPNLVGKYGSIFGFNQKVFTTAWRLYRATGDEKYHDDYNRIWQWSWTHMIDHENGAWFRVRNQDGSKIDDKKSPLGKTDYHTLGACWDVLSVMTSEELS